MQRHLYVNNTIAFSFDMVAKLLTRETLSCELDKRLSKRQTVEGESEWSVF